LRFSHNTGEYFYDGEGAEAATCSERFTIQCTDVSTIQRFLAQSHSVAVSHCRSSCFSLRRAEIDLPTPASASEVEATAAAVTVTTAAARAVGDLGGFRVPRLAKGKGKAAPLVSPLDPSILSPQVTTNFGTWLHTWLVIKKPHDSAHNYTLDQRK
jgi:hypothetical protein